MTTDIQTTEKLAGMPPPLPAAAMSAAKKPLSEAGEALFGGMKQHLATKGTPNVMGKLLKTGSAELDVVQEAFLDELAKIAADLQEKDAGLRDMLGGARRALVGGGGGTPVMKTAAKDKEPKKGPSLGAKALAGYLGGPGGYFGLMKGHPQGEGAEGAIRGAVGSSLGAGLGGGLGGALGQAAGTALGRPNAGGLIGAGVGTLAGGIGGYKALTSKYNQPPEKTAADLTEAARGHLAKKNFAVSAKESNTGKPAYPIEDKAHARSALGFAAMHHDKKDLAEVKKDVEKKFPGMVHEKAAAALRDAFAALQSAA